MIAAQFRKFDEEKAELFEQIRELEKASSDYKSVKNLYDQKLFFTWWLFTAKLRSIKFLGSFEEKA